jgi:hypothetical protein
MSSDRTMQFSIDMDVDNFEKYEDMTLYNYFGFSRLFMDGIMQWMETTTITQLVEFSDAYYRHSNYFNSSRFYFPYEEERIYQIAQSPRPTAPEFLLPTQRMPTYQWKDDKLISALLQQIRDGKRRENQKDGTEILAQTVIQLYEVTNAKFKHFYDATKREIVIGKSLMQAYNMSQISTYAPMYDIKNEEDKAVKWNESIRDEILDRRKASPTRPTKIDFYDMFNWLLEFLETVVVDSHYELKSKLEGRYIGDFYFDSSEFSDYTGVGPDMDDYLDEEGDIIEEAMTEAMENFEWSDYRGDFPHTWAAITIDNFQLSLRNSFGTLMDSPTSITSVSTDSIMELMKFITTPFAIMRFQSDKPMAEVGEEEAHLPYNDRTEKLHIYDLSNNNLDNPDDKTELLVDTQYATPNSSIINTASFNTEDKGAFFVQSDEETTWLNFNLSLEFRIPGIALINYVVNLPRLLDI